MGFHNENMQMYVEKLSNIDNPMALTLTIHLYTEYWIIKLIECFSPIANEILDNRVYTYSIKLSLIYNMGLIPENLYKNLKKLNKLRNEYAHNLDFDYKGYDLGFLHDDGISILKEIKNEGMRRTFMFIGMTTFEWLASLSLRKIYEAGKSVPGTKIL